MGKFSGTIQNSLDYSYYEKFSTFDHDNDGFEKYNCAATHKSGWWYKKCSLW
ncbi:hypothetical protein KR215_006902 [Drosophila sulfurigaster]|nr:hypothetical protein KR215_006902 [Drosophila sulfurigaster]